MENEKYPKFQPIPRFHRDVVLSEKVDGTNGLISINEDRVRAGCRNRWLEPTKAGDNHGFAAWVDQNAGYLVTDLGMGEHYGEWFGHGINRGYGLDVKKFALFNTYRWADKDFYTPNLTVVPVIGYGPASDLNQAIEYALRHLEMNGSEISPGYMKPEGIVIYHTAANNYFKVTLEKDEMPKSQVKS